MDIDAPVQIAPSVWWVGVRLPDDVFQCHAYYIDNGDDGVLLDPGSPLTIGPTLAKIAQIAELSSIKYLVCHHPDPDIAASLPYLSEHLSRPDVLVVTEWRAQALLKHYGHRFDYYRVEEHGWRVPLGAGRSLQFQLTPYLHFPGAMVSYDTQSRTLFSSDLFGGFVPDSSVLVSDDLDYIIESARPFHQHYMPSRELLSAGLERIRHRWPDIAQIAPQHGHVIPTTAVAGAFEALSNLDCGVFTLADADLDLKRLLRISEARSRLTEALLTIADPSSLVAAMDSILAGTHEARNCALFIDLPDEGWTMWAAGLPHSVRQPPNPAWPSVDLPGSPMAMLSIHTRDDQHPDGDLLNMLGEMARSVRPAVDQYLSEHREGMRSAALAKAAFSDPLTGLGNRRAFESRVPVGTYSLISLDLDHFKEVNDTFGHGSGDIVLQGVADVLRASVRDMDSVYRLGGEEFLVCLPGATQAASYAIAERIRTSVRTVDFDGNAPDGRVTVSTGVAVVLGGTTSDLPVALKAADEALYESKDAGRDRTTMRTVTSIAHA